MVEQIRPKIEYAEIVTQLEARGHMRKYYGKIQQVIQNLNITPEEQNIIWHNQDSFDGRDLNHIIRMLERSEIEKNFALAYCIYNPTTLYDEYSEIQMRIQDCINSEGVDTTLFWTFCSYIYNELLQHDISEESAMKYVLDWAQHGVSAATRPRIDEGWGEVHLPGLEFLNEYEKNSYILNPDPSHVSHEFTRQEAKRIALLLLESE